MERAVTVGNGGEQRQLYPFCPKKYGNKEGKKLLILSYGLENPTREALSPRQPVLIPSPAPPLCSLATVMSCSTDTDTRRYRTDTDMEIRHFLKKPDTWICFSNFL